MNNLLNRVGMRYLLLHRENYVDNPDDIQEYLAKLSAELSPNAIEESFKNADWRVKIVGTYVAIAGRRVIMVGRLGDMLLDSSSRSIRRSIAVALTALATEKSVALLEGFVSAPYISDSLHEYAAAIEGIRILTGREPEILPIILNRLLQEGHTLDAFEESRRRFRRAVQFWTKAKM